MADRLKTIMKASRDEGLDTSVEIERRKFRVLREEMKQIYCSEAELNETYKLKLKDKPHVEIARDIFLVGC